MRPGPGSPANPGHLVSRALLKPHRLLEPLMTEEAQRAAAAPEDG
ncbi:hypothetical protein [Streptomyces sp. 8N616]